MAWVNAVLEDFTTGNITGDIDTISTVINPQSKQASSTDYYENFGYIASFNQSNYINATIDDRAIIFGSLELGLSIIRTSDGFISLQYPYYADGQFIEYRTLKNWSRSAINMYSSYQHDCSIFCTINEDTHKGTIIAYSIDFNTGYWNRLNHSVSYANELTNSELAYNIIKDNEYVQYTWQSVPNISGKNGILQNLVQIKEEAINDGEPVSEATVLSFDSLGNVNIPSIIDEQMPVDPSDVTSVTATYLIPALENGTYEGIKLLVKKGSIPTSEQDADKVVNLDEPTSILRIGSKSVGNLDEDSHYYFVIFIEDEQGNTASSEPKSCITEKMPKFNITSIANAGTSFIVNYRINDYSTIENYRDIKLVAKANGIPSNKNDGYIIDITNNFYESQDSSWSNVDNEIAYVGLPNAESYGFKIFADDDISNSMIKETTQGTSPYIMNVLIWFSGAYNVGRPEQDRHYGYIPCYFAVPISQIDYQVGIWTDESSTKFGNLYIRNTKDGENLISQEFSGRNTESPKTFTCELSEAVSGLKWLVFNDPANSGWNPAVLQLAFYMQ